MKELVLRRSIALCLSVWSSLTLSTALEAKTISGTYNGLSYTASNSIIGQTSTATVAGGGDPRYLAQTPPYRGVVELLMDEGAAGRFVCSGSLSADRSSIITAGHCVSDGKSTLSPKNVTVFFYDGNAADPVAYTPGAAGVTSVGVSNVFVNSKYTGEVIDDHDIAVLRLASAAPSYAQGYQLYGGTDLTGLDYNTAGYGVRSDVGGALGSDLGPGRLRQGDNRYDFRLGDPDFFGVFAGQPNDGGFFGSAETDYSYLSDFDDGLAINDASCGLAGIFGSGGSKYCNLGLGAQEVSIGGGDSGGPQFVNGQLASVSGYLLSFGQDVQPGDIDDVLNQTFGEFNGFVPIFNNLGFINYALSATPEPGTWAMMLFGIGMVGGAMRRREGKAAPA
jgi:hypothetical protein